MIKPIEKYYTVQQLGWLLELDAKTIRLKAHAGAFGDAVLNLEGKDLRVPASGVNAYLENQRVFPRDVEPIAARSVGELRRKAATLERQVNGHQVESGGAFSG